MSGPSPRPTPLNMTHSRPWPACVWIPGRRRQVQRQLAARDEHPPGSPRWHGLNGDVVFTQLKLADLEARWPR